MKDLVIGLFLGAITSVIWVSYYYNEKFIKEYKKQLSSQVQENGYLKNELTERNNELIQAYQYIKHLNFQIETFQYPVAGNFYQEQGGFDSL